MHLIMWFLSFLGSFSEYMEKELQRQRWRSLAPAICIQKHSSLGGCSAVILFSSFFFICFLLFYHSCDVRVGCKSMSKSSFPCSYESHDPKHWILFSLSTPLHSTPHHDLILFSIRIFHFHWGISVNGLGTNRLLNSAVVSTTFFILLGTNFMGI